MDVSTRSLKKKIFKILKEDEEFRYAVAGFIGIEEILKRLNGIESELLRLREDMQRGFERVDKVLIEHSKRMDRIETELLRLREDMQKGFDYVQRHLTALGARWGIESETAFRNGLKGIIEKELGYRVERWTGYDEEGLVYGYPSQVELDIVVHDSKIILVEIMSHAKVSDVYELMRKKKFYEKTMKKKVSKAMIITPYAEEKVFEAVRRHKISIYTDI